MNPLANKKIKYVKRVKLLIRGEMAPSENIFDNKKKSPSCLNLALYLFFNMVLRDKLLS